MRGEEPRQTFLCEGIDGVERLRRGAALELDELVCLLEAHEGVCEAVRRAAEAGRNRIGGILALRRQQKVHERGGHRAEHEEESSGEPSAEATRLYESGRDHDGGRLDDDVAVADVGEPVRQPSFELSRGQRRDEPCADGKRGCAWAAAGRERARVPVRDQVQPRLRYAGDRRETLDGRVQDGGLAERKLAGADEAERDAIRVPVGAAGEQEGAEHEDREEPVATTGEADRTEERTG